MFDRLYLAYIIGPFINCLILQFLVELYSCQSLLKTANVCRFCGVNLIWYDILYQGFSTWDTWAPEGMQKAPGVCEKVQGMQIIA